MRSLAVGSWASRSMLKSRSTTRHGHAAVWESGCKGEAGARVRPVPASQMLHLSSHSLPPARQSKSSASETRALQWMHTVSVGSSALGMRRLRDTATLMYLCLSRQAINVNLEQAIISAINGAGFTADKFPTEVMLTSFYLPVRQQLRTRHGIVNRHANRAQQICEALCVKL